MTDSEITLIRYRMERSKEALSAAELMYEEDHFNDAVNRLYYFCFYAVIALLATEGLQPSKHTAARSLLNKNWIKTGRLSKETGWLYNTLFDRREKGDYGDYFRFQKEDVAVWLKAVNIANKEIFQAIEEQVLEL